MLKPQGAGKRAHPYYGGEQKPDAAARNIPSVKVLRMDNINVYDLLKYRYLITTQEALNSMQEVYGK
jgi:ribosomal protein L4